MADERPRRRAQGTPSSARLGATPAGADAHHAARWRASAGCSCSSTVVFVVVWLPMHTFDPPPSDDWAPLSDQASRAATCSRSNNCFVCHSGLLAAAGRARGALLPLPEGLPAGRLLRQRPVAQPARHRAHRARPLAGVGLAPRRLAVRALLRPALRRSALADAADEVALLGHAGGGARRVRRDAQRQVRPAALRRPALREARRARGAGLPAAVHGLPGRAQADRRAERRTAARRRSQLEEAPNLSQIDRSYWLSGNPLPVTEQNLMRGKEVFLARCVGCHGDEGRRQGPGARFMSPPPADFTDKDDACCGGDTGPGRLLLPHPARLDRHRRWRTSASGSRSTTSGASCCSSRRSRTARSRPTWSPSRTTTSPGSPRRSCSPG